MGKVERLRGDGKAIDERLPTPLYHQIYLILRDKILGGAYEPMELIPSELEIAALFKVSRITAKRALDELAADGLVTRQRGRGTQVAARQPAPPIKASVEGLLETLLAMGVQTEVQLLDHAYVPAGEEVARALGIPAGEMVQRAVRVRRLEGQPFSHLTTFVPAAIGQSFAAADLASTPLLVLLERCGVVVGRAQQTITACLADPLIAMALDCAIGAPLLKVTRVVYDQTDRAVELIVALYRPDRYLYQMNLSRVQGETSPVWSPSV